jgi:putative hydrolases of HD superfamily
MANQALQYDWGSAWKTDGRFTYLRRCRATSEAHVMLKDEITGALDFLRQAERLKDVLRTSHSSSGRPESTAEHSWRMCLWAIVFSDKLRKIGLAKLLKICVVHDLGEALTGDIPAVSQTPGIGKAIRERTDLEALTRSLTPTLRDEILSLWDEYQNASSLEAVLAKGLDKLETILQHNQGRNPADFDYAFNLTYGLKHTSADPLLAEIRSVLDDDTRARVSQQRHKDADPDN